MGGGADGNPSVLRNLLGIDEAPVGAAEIDYRIALFVFANFCVAARDFVVADLNRTVMIAAERELLTAQVVALAFVATLQYEERCHEPLTAAAPGMCLLFLPSSNGTRSAPTTYAALAAICSIV